MKELTTDQIATLRALERLKRLAPMERGGLRALRRQANPEQARRIDLLLDRHPRHTRSA